MVLVPLRMGEAGLVLPLSSVSRHLLVEGVRVVVLVEGAELSLKMSATKMAIILTELVSWYIQTVITVFGPEIGFKSTETCPVSISHTITMMCLRASHRGWCIVLVRAYYLYPDSTREQWSSAQ